MAKASFVDSSADVLRKKAAPVKINKTSREQISSVEKLLASLPIEAIAIAAPQVGIPLRFFVYRRSDGDIRAVINPKVVWTSQDNDNEVVYSDITGEVAKSETLPEECLSLPGQECFVERPFAIKVEYLTEKGVSKREFLQGGAARIFLHETDHLDGILISDRAVEGEPPKEVIAEDREPTDEELAEMLAASLAFSNRKTPSQE